MGMGFGVGMGFVVSSNDTPVMRVDLQSSMIDPPLSETNAPISETDAPMGPPLTVTRDIIEAENDGSLQDLAHEQPPSIADATRSEIPPDEAPVSAPAQPEQAAGVAAGVAAADVGAGSATEQTAFLQLAPAADPDAWKTYMVPSAPASGKPRIAIVVDDLGIDQPRSWQTIDLKPPLTLAILPYGYNLQEMSDAARARGHEILVHVPMAPLDLGVDPGPNALQQELGPAEIARRLEWDLSQFTGYIGMNNHMGSRFTADADSMAIVIETLRHRGLAFLDSVTSIETKGYLLAEEAGIPFARRDVFLDNDASLEAIEAQLQRLESVALTNGFAIAIGHPRDSTLHALRRWREGAEARGFEFVPLSALLQARSPS